MMPVSFSNASYSECDTYKCGKFSLICGMSFWGEDLTMKSGFVQIKIAAIKSKEIFCSSL